jgi:hypothetical protein
MRGARRRLFSNQSRFAAGDFLDDAEEGIAREQAVFQGKQLQTA